MNPPLKNVSRTFLVFSRIWAFLCKFKYQSKFTVPEKECSQSSRLFSEVMSTTGRVVSVEPVRGRGGVGGRLQYETDGDPMLVGNFSFNPYRRMSPEAGNWHLNQDRVAVAWSGICWVCAVKREEVHMATTLDMATYLDCLNLKRNAERECRTSVLQMTGCPSQYF